MKFPECKYENTEMELAIADKLDIGFEDHGFLVMFGGLNYGSGFQGIGLTLSVEFLKRFLRVFSVDALSECNGRYVFVEHSMERIHRLIPLNFDGEEENPEFDIFQWSKEKTVEIKRGKKK
jgi:hypothetical protein